MTEKTAITTLSNEELVCLIQRGQNTECAYQQLFINLKPIILREAQMYRSQMADFDTDDFLQEGYILVWKIIDGGGFKGGKFANYYTTAIRRKYIDLYRSYVLKNAICISKSEDIYIYGCQICTLVESDYARRYREKHKAQCKAWNERKKAERLASGQPASRKKKVLRQTKFTEEERKERHRQRSLEYYRTHRDECNRKSESDTSGTRRRRRWAKTARDFWESFTVRRGENHTPGRI